MNAKESATMAPSPPKNPDDTTNPEDAIMHDDDETVVAETPPTKIDFIEQEMTDINIRYEIPYRKGTANADDFKQHVQLLIAITTAYDKSTIRIYDNQNNRIRSFNEPKWNNKEYFEDHFTIHDETSQRKSVIVHRMMTKKTISEIKNEPTILQHLKTSSTYLRGHFWKQDEVSLKDIGFLLSYVPTKHSKEFVAKDIFDRCAESPDIYWSDVPEFKLIHAQPKVTLSGRKNPLKTHAFSVQVLATEASKMNRFLQAIYSKDHHYLPYTMKKNFPKAVAAAILAQNKLIKTTWVIVLVGIHRNAMPEIENNIRASPGVTGISETNRTDQNGRWNILVHEHNFKSIRKLLTKNIQDWVSNVPPAIQATIPDTFPAPKVYQKNSYNDDDDDSSFGQASYMSSCAQSYASFDNDMDEQFFNPPGKHSSYASALSSTIPNPSGTDVLIPAKRRAVPAIPASPSVDAQATAYQTTIANLQHEVIIAQLQAEIQTLKADLRGATTPSTVTEMSTPMSNTQVPSSTNDRMATIENNMEILTQQFSTWMTELRNKDYGHALPKPQDRPAHQQVPPETALVLLPPDTGTKHPIDEDSAGQRIKRIDRRKTPTRPDPMAIDDARVTLFLEQAPDSPIIQALHTSNTTTDNNDISANIPPRSVQHPIHLPDHPYDPLRKQYTYQYNGDGTMFCSGQASPSDFIDDVIQGPRPSNPQHAQEIWDNDTREICPPTPPSVIRFNTQPEEIEPIDLSDSELNQGQLSPERKTLDIVTGSLSPSLLAEGAQTVHA
jgi:hypothetical protein